MGFDWVGRKGHSSWKEATGTEGAADTGACALPLTLEFALLTYLSLVFEARDYSRFF